MVLTSLTNTTYQSDANMMDALAALLYQFVEFLSQSFQLLTLKFGDTNSLKTFSLKFTNHSNSNFNDYLVKVIIFKYL